MSKDAATQLRQESQIVVRNLKVRDLKLVKQRDAGSFLPGQDAVTQNTIAEMLAAIAQLDRDISELRHG